MIYQNFWGNSVNIAVKNLKKTFVQGDQSLIVLKNINVEFQEGKTYAITGVSGTGKSTFLHLIAGIDEPTKGHVSFDGKDLDKLSANQKNEYLNKMVGLVFQYAHLISELSVLENIMLAGLIAGKSSEECKQKALRLLKDVGLEQKAGSQPDSLSGGQQQRVAIARAIFNEPKFLLADEPTGNLDIKTGRKIVDLILKCQQKWGMGVIISSHDPYVAESMEYIYTLSDGILNVA